jgi:general secretion pathway protein G
MTNRQKRPSALQRGFTLLELLVVILIIALLTSVIGPRLFQQVSDARVRTARAQMKTLQDALVRYRLDTGAYPDATQGLGARQAAPAGVSGWLGPYLQGSVPNDPWGHAYVWRNPGADGHEVEIISWGSDGKPGGSGEAADLVQGF